MKLIAMSKGRKRSSYPSKHNRTWLLHRFIGFLGFTLQIAEIAVASASKKYEGERANGEALDRSAEWTAFGLLAAAAGHVL